MTRTLYHVYGFDGIKRFGPHKFGIESYYDNKDEAIRVAKNIADNIEDYDVPSQTITIVKRCDFDKRGLCVFEEEVWGSVLGDMSEPGLIPDMEEFLKSDEEENMFESEIKESKEFPGNDLHSRLCQFTYDTVDYFDLADAVGDYGDYPSQRDSIHAAIWDMSDEELIEGIKYGLEEGNLSYYGYPNLSLEELENNAKRDAQALVDEYNKEYSIKESKMRESKTKTLYYIYGFDGEKRFGPHNFKIEVYYDNKEEAISIAKNIAKNIDKYMVPEDLQIIVREEVYDRRDVCISSDIIWSSLLDRVNESKDKDIQVDFDINVSEKGRIKANDARKLLKYLAQNKLLKVGRTYFVKDASGNETCWGLERSEFDGYNFFCEVTDGEDAEGNYIERDYYNNLYFCKRNGKLTDFEWESYKVY